MSIPLATQIRPKTLDECIGQEHLIGKGKPIWTAIQHQKLYSMVFWGPPGTGKTTLAYILSKSIDAHFVALSAVLAGVKDIRETVSKAQKIKTDTQKETIVFIDEIHRFNKAQQDALLPHVEDGSIILIGATTENPSFELNNALLSRVRVYVLKTLTETQLNQLIDRAISFQNMAIHIDEPIRKQLCALADGDARQLINLLEVCIDFAETTSHKKHIDKKIIDEVLPLHYRRFDRQGEYFYDLISALHKSVRGSDPQASLYWLARMIDGGCDPLYIARRVVRMASEDIGNADPRALQLALNAWDVQERLGSPEGELAIAQAVTYMACAAKSNAVYTAWNTVLHDVKTHGSCEVPFHLRNAPTRLMKELGYGKKYRYAHDEPHAYAANEHYFPENMKPKTYYQPTDRGLEKQIQEKLNWLRKLDKENKS